MSGYNNLANNVIYRKDRAIGRPFPRRRRPVDSLSPPAQGRADNCNWWSYKYMAAFNDTEPNRSRVELALPEFIQTTDLLFHLYSVEMNISYFKKKKNIIFWKRWYTDKKK